MATAAADRAPPPPAAAAALPGEHEAYFAELLQYPLDRLSKEPDLLAAEQAQLERAARDAAASHHGAFLAAADCLEGLRGQLDAARAGLDALLATDLPALEAAGAAFRARAAELNRRRAALARLAAGHAAVVDLLEVPALMDTCVRAGAYDEALDLRAFVDKVAVVHGDLPAVRALAAGARGVAAAMLAALEERLEGDVALPECLRVVGYLRRLAPCGEAELRRRFLARREAWVAAAAGAPDPAAPYEFLKRLTDVHRLHLFDVAMQFRALFADDDGAGGGALAGWAERRVAAYLAALDEHLPRLGDGGSLASVLDAAMYAGASLGRVGLDFRPLLAPRFEAAAAGLFRAAVDAATDAGAGLLAAHRWAAPPAAAAAAAARARAPEAGGDAAAAAGGPPPAALMEHPPLAVYANGLLAALNELRHCAPLSLRGAAAAALQASLAGVAAALAAAGATDGSAGGAAAHRAACRAYASVLAPYVAACFERVYAGGGRLLDLKAAAAPLADALAAGDAAAGGAGGGA